MKLSAIAALLRQSSGLAKTNRRRNQHCQTQVACVSVEFCEPRVLLSATGDDHVDLPGPDATVVTVDPVNSSLTLNGVIDGINDTDVFQFDVPVNSFARFQSDPPGPLGQPSLSAMSFSGGSWIEADQNSSNVLPAGKWFVRVSGNPSLQQGEYAVRLILEAGLEDDHPDVWGPDATVVPPGPIDTPLTFSGRLGHINDKDFFQFHLDQAAQLIFEWNSVDQSHHGEVAIFDAIGRQVSGSGPGSPELSNGVSLTAGQWWVMISGNPSFQSGDYSVLGRLDDYPDAPTDVPGPNWQIISPDSSVTGHLETPNDVDVLRFEVTQQSDLHLPTPPGVQAIVTDSSGRVVTLKDDSVRLAPGVYFVSVKAAGVPVADSSYSLNASLMPVFLPAVQVTGGIGPSIDRTPNLIWQPVEGATSYDVYVGVTGDSKAVFRQTGITQTSFEVPVDLKDGDYTVWVKALLPNNRRSVWGNGFSLRIGAAPQFTGISAATGDVSWIPVAGATRYEVWLGKVDPKTGARTRLLQESTTETTWTIPGSVPGGNYGVWVRSVRETANSKDHFSKWNDGEIFKLADVVTAPVIDNWKLTQYFDPSVADAGGLTDAAAVISIGQAPGPIFENNSLLLHSGDLFPQYVIETSYEFRIIDVESGATLLTRRATETLDFQSDPVIGVRLVKFTYVVISWEDANLLNGRDTAVQVRTKYYLDPTEFFFLVPMIPRASQWSAPFPIAVGYSTGHISSQAKTASGLPILSWPVAPDRVVLEPVVLSNRDPFRALEYGGPPREFNTWTARYDVWIDDAFSGAQVVRESSLLTNQLSVPNNLAPGVYAARVRATYADGTVALWSPAYKFQIMSVPVAITGGTVPTVDATPNISWQPAPGTASYEVWIGPKGSQTPTYRATGLTSTQHRVATPLNPGSYEVFVRAHLPNGAVSHWGAPTALQIGTPPVVTLTGRTVSWKAVNGATRYELWVNRIDDQGKLVAAKVISDDQIVGTSTTLPAQTGKFRVWIRAIRNEAAGTYYSNWSRAIEV